MRNKYKVGILLLIAIILFITYNILLRNQEAYALSKYGSRGDEVKQIQTKLKNWGYYNGSVDGIYGSGTLAAVKSFQRKNGLTVLNRVRSSKFPNTVSGVVYQSGAFTCVQDGQINLAPDATSKKAAQDAINGWDPTYGALYYFNPNTATNAWIWSRPMTITIGNHRFCK